MVGILKHSKVMEAEKMARPAGLEPATPGLEGPDELYIFQRLNLIKPNITTRYRAVTMR